MQSALSGSAAFSIGEQWGRGNDGSVESVENQRQVFHASHRSLKIPQNPRDFHIPTAPACTAWKSGKTKDSFPTFPPGARDDDDRPVCKIKSQRKEVGRYAATSFSRPDFMLILQLENAAAVRRTWAIDYAGCATWKWTNAKLNPSRDGVPSGPGSARLLRSQPTLPQKV
jgi:hypothetical protein